MNLYKIIELSRHEGERNLKKKKENNKISRERKQCVKNVNKTQIRQQNYGTYLEGGYLAISPRPFRFTTLVRYPFELTKLFVERIKVLVETENPAS